MSQSHDGFPLGCVERSSHLEEYTRSRPASAGSRPRSLLSKVANAAAAVQQDDDSEPPDAEPWVLEGWGDGPSVSEAAQQAALRLGPYNKNVPTTLVGLGAGGGRRVLSAGNHGRSPLKVSEARRKPGIGPANVQGERRASGPAALAQPGHGATAIVRRHPPPRTLDVGDESDVEPTPGPAMGAGAGTGAGPSSYGHAALGQGSSRIAQPTYRGAPPVAAAAPAVAAGPSMRSQHPGGAQSGVPGPAVPGFARAGRRDAGGGQPAAANPWGHPAAATASGAAAAANGSPRHRSLSAESYHAGSPGASSGGPASRAPQPLSAAAAARNAAAAAAAAAVTAKLNAASPAHPPVHHPPIPPQPTPGHLEPLNPPGGSRYVTGRPAGLPNDTGVGHSDRRPSSGQLGSLAEPQPPARASSFSDLSSPTPHPLADHLEALGNPTSGPLAAAAASVGFGGHGAAAPPPPLPGLLLTGRRSSSFRAEGGLSGWDSDAPAVQVPQATSMPHGASNVSLWIGPTTAGAGAAAAGLQGGPAASGRGSPLLAGQPSTRREQVAGGGSSSRLQRGAPAGPAMGLGTGLRDLSLGPERSAEKVGGAGGVGGQAAGAVGRGATGRGQAGGAAGHGAVQSTSRSASPDPGRGFMGCPPGFTAPQQDALTEFCASRADLGSAGASSGSSVGAGTGQEARGHSGSAGGPSMVMPLSVAMPMRMGSMNKMPAAAHV